MSILGSVRRLFTGGGDLPSDTVITKPLVDNMDIEEPVHENGSLAELVRNQAPPVELGIPVLTLEQLLVTQKELIENLQTIGELDLDQFRTIVMPVIQRFAAFVHLLPASENYHHHGTGGLLNHSFDVALRCGQLIQNKYLQNPTASPSENNAVKKRWPYAAMLAGLCHDLAKPFSDFTVTDMDQHLVWDPFSETLLDWAQRNDLKRYRYTWNSVRYGKHEQLAGGLIHQILTPEFSSWLREAGSTITYPLFQVIAYGSATPNINVLRSVVLEADRRSTITDVHRWQEARKEIGMKVKMERYMLNIIKEQIISGDWTVNEDDSIVWVVEGDVFLDWKEASAFLIYKLEELELTGLPDTPNAIADLLINSDIAMRNLSNPNQPKRFWDITIPLESQGGSTIMLRKRALRFVSPDYVLDRIYESRMDARILKTEEPPRENETITTSVNAQHIPATVVDAQDPQDDSDERASDTNLGRWPEELKTFRSSGTEDPEESSAPHEDHRSATGNRVFDGAPGKPTTNKNPAQEQNRSREAVQKGNTLFDQTPLATKKPVRSQKPGRKSKPGSLSWNAGKKSSSIASAMEKESLLRNPESDREAQATRILEELVAALSKSKRLEARLIEDEVGDLVLLFPDGFLGSEKPSLLRKQFLNLGIVHRTNSKKYFRIDRKYQDKLYPLLRK